MSPTNTFFSVISALSFPLVCIPLPWHLEAWNTGTCLFMMWTAVGLFISCVNSIIWREDAFVRVPFWCDITTKICIGWSVGIPAASLCINRRLYLISSVRSLTWSKAEKVRAILFDMVIGLLIPMLVMVLHFIVQGHRFNIFEEIGCLPTVANTWVSFVIIYMPPLILLLISLSYCARSLFVLRKTQKELSEVLSSNSSLTTSRFYRLMALSGMDILINLPFQLATVIINKDNFHPWISWEDTHYDFGRIYQVPSILWKDAPMGRGLEFSRWSLVVCAVVFFLFFGFAEEARKHYKSSIGLISRRVGISPTNSLGHKIDAVASSVGRFKTIFLDKLTKRSKPSGPVTISKEVFEKRDSTMSFTTIGETEVGTLRTPMASRGNTLTKNPLADDRRILPSPSFRLSMPSDADQQSFLEFSSNDREILPSIVHKV